MRKIRVFLCGGMRGGWQDRLIEALVADAGRTDFEFIDPRRNGTKEYVEYTALDKHHIRACNVVFAYLEEENPSGMGLACEVAFAHALGKTVILVNEKEHRYDRFPDAFADVVFSKLEDGIEFLRRLQ